MENLSEEDLKFLEENNISLDSIDLSTSPSTSQEPEEKETDEKPAPFGSLYPNSFNYQGGSEQEWKDYVNSIVEANTPKDTGPAPIDDTRDAFTYDNLYGTFESPETGEIKQKPDLSLYDRIGAIWYDMTLSDDAESASSQVARDQYKTDKSDWAEATRDLFEGQSFYTENGQRVYDRFVPVKDEAGNILSYNQEKVLIPDPLLDQSAFNRVLEQAGRNIYQEFGGLFTEGAIIKESEFAASRPDLDQAGGEALATGILSIAAPVVPIAKVFNYGGKLLKYGKEGAKGASLGTTGAVGTEALGVSLAEAIMSSDGDEGFLIKPEFVKEQLPILNDTQAQSLAITLDGLIVNGAADGLLSLAAKGLGFFFKKKESIKQLNQKTLETAVKDGTVLEVVKYLDPEFEKLNPVEMKLRLTALANILDDNRVIELSLGGATREITNDTTNAIMMGSEAYIRETRAGLKDTMSEADFDKFVNDEAARMSSSMIGLFRSQQSNPAVQAGVDRVPSEIAGFVNETASELVGGNIDEAAQTVASSVVKASDEEVAGLTARADDVVAQTDKVLAAQATVVQDNPIVQDLIATNTGGYGLFNTNNTEVRQALTEIVADEGYIVFKEAMDNVDAAYKALPEAEIDAELLRNTLIEVTRAADALDGTGRRTRAAQVLRDVFEGFAPQRVGTRTDPIPIVGEAADSAIMETPEEVIERITQEVSFKDLYNLKAKLASVIDSYRNDLTIQRRLIEFRNHITDTENGQMAYVIANADEGVAGAFQAADNQYKQAMADFTNSEPLKRLTDKMQAVRKFDTPQGKIPGDDMRNEPNMVLGSNQFVDEVVGDQTGTLMNQLTNMLKGLRTETELNGPFRDLFRAQAANALRDSVASGAAKSTDTPENILFEAFRPVREQLQALGDTTLLDDVTKAYEDIRKAYGDLGNTKLANDETLKQINADILRAQEGVVGLLIDTPRGSVPVGVSGPSRSTPTSSAKNVLSTIMESNNSENRIKELMDKIALLPDEAQRTMATRALKAVALDSIGTKLIGASPTAMKSGTEVRNNMAMGKAKKLTSDEASNLFKSMNAVYGKDSEMSDLVINLVNTMYQTSLPSRLKTSQAGSDTILNAARDSNIRDAVSTAILLSAGYMNPTAALLRRISSVPVAEAEKLQKEVAAHVLATVVSNPEKFEEMLRQLVVGKTNTAKDIAKQIAATTGGTSVLGLRYEFRVQEEDAFGPEEENPIDRDMLQLFGYQQ